MGGHSDPIGGHFELGEAPGSLGIQAEPSWSGFVQCGNRILPNREGFYADAMVRRLEFCEEPRLSYRGRDGT
jgi:hypothetical protein